MGVGVEFMTRFAGVFSVIISLAGLVVAIAAYRRGSQRITVSVVDSKFTDSVDTFRPLGDLSGVVQISNFGSQTFPVERVAIYAQIVEPASGPREMDERIVHAGELHVVADYRTNTADLRAYGAIRCPFRFVPMVEVNIDRFYWEFYPAITLENGKIIRGKSFLIFEWPNDWVEARREYEARERFRTVIDRADLD